MGLASATLNGHKVTDARLTIPAWGASYHDVSIDGEVSLSGAATLVVADLTIKGTFLSGGPAVGRSYFRIVAGSGGWGKLLPKKAYANDLGVKFTTVLGDAASAVGETIVFSDADKATKLGPAFVRAEAPASRLLELLAPNNWYISEDGATHFGQRSKTTLNSKAARVTPLDKARGTLTLASETIANILPGIVVDGLEAVDVEHEISAKGGLRSKLWGRQGGGNSRRLAAFRSIVDQIDPDRKFRGCFEYRVVSQTGNRLNLQAIRVSTGMPDLLRVYVRPGTPGTKADHPLGARVIVGFVDNDPARPFVSNFEDADGSGFIPTTLSIEGGQVLVGSAPFPLAFAAGTTTTLDALNTWAAALVSALNANATPPLAGAAMATPTATLVTAITAAHASVPTVVIKGT